MSDNYFETANSIFEEITEDEYQRMIPFVEKSRVRGTVSLISGNFNIIIDSNSKSIRGKNCKRFTVSQLLIIAERLGVYINERPIKKDLCNLIQKILCKHGKVLCVE